MGDSNSRRRHPGAQGDLRGLLPMALDPDPTRLGGLLTGGIRLIPNGTLCPEAIHVPVGVVLIPQPKSHRFTLAVAIPLLGVAFHLPELMKGVDDLAAAVNHRGEL